MLMNDELRGDDSHDLFKGAVPAFHVEIERNYRPHQVHQYSY
jgi:hypothetical protein